MKGTVHVAIGASAPIGLVATQSVTALQGVTMAAVSAGFALLPDIDSPKSLATSAMGPVVHRFVHKLCKTVVGLTSTARDRNRTVYMQIRSRDPYHRTVTHTLAAALVLWGTTYAAAWIHPVAVGLIAALGVLLLWPLCRATVALVVFGAAATAAGSALLLSPWLFSLAVGGGYLSHIVADACTKAGVPVLWPVNIKGKRWWNIRLLSGMVTSGSPLEKGPAVGVSLAANALLLFLQF